MVLANDEMKVMIGSGSKAHVFRARHGSNMKLFALRDGDTAYDRALCGAGGEMREADPDAELCKTCESILEREAEAA